MLNGRIFRAYLIYKDIHLNKNFQKRSQSFFLHAFYENAVDLLYPTNRLAHQLTRLIFTSRIRNDEFSGEI
jgi:hypothetical protein